MANVMKRENKDGTLSFLIRVYVDETNTGKQIVKTKTWKAPKNMRITAAEKEAAKQAAIFEDQVKRGLIAFDSSTKFGDYAKQWIENEPLAPKTRARYWDLYKRINETLGHIKLEKLQASHLERFYKSLAENGENKHGSYATAKSSLKEIIKSKKLTEKVLAKSSGVCITTIQSAKRGNKVNIKTAEKISKAIEKNCEDLFLIHKSELALSDQTIHHHHRLISAILERAKRQRLVPFNIAKEHTRPPRVKRKEAKYLTDEQAIRFLSFVIEEPDIRKKSAFVLLLFTGIRLGELCGLTWEDIDDKKELIHVRRASQYLNGQGVVTVETKNKYSVRSIKVDTFVLDVLKEYRIWWNEHRLLYGKDWQGKERQLFIQEKGKPIYPGTIRYWLRKFIKTHNLPYITPHGLRHTFITIHLISGVDLRTLQSITGHSHAAIILNRYAHVIESAQNAAAQSLANILLQRAK